MAAIDRDDEAVS